MAERATANAVAERAAIQKEVLPPGPAERFNLSVVEVQALHGRLLEVYTASATCACMITDQLQDLFG